MCYEGKQMSHYLCYNAIELGKNSPTRGDMQSYLTVYSITFITTGCICTCQVKVSNPGSHESFSALMKTTPASAGSSNGLPALGAQGLRTTRVWAQEGGLISRAWGTS